MATFDTESLRLALELRDVEGFQTAASGRTKRVATGKRTVAAPRTRTRQPRKAKAPTEQTTALAQATDTEAKQETSAPAIASAEALRCSVCMEVLNENPTFRAPCNRLYCATCLIGHVTASIADKVDGGPEFPPECCSVPIPILGVALELLPAQSEDPFIPPSNFTDDYGTCAAYGQQTCILCRTAKHDGICPGDPTQNAVREAGTPEGLAALHPLRTLRGRRPRAACICIADADGSSATDVAEIGGIMPRVSGGRPTASSGVQLKGWVKS
ncbi:IBR finger domain protein [Cordyceps fumosorosea ARSEF 2679]|uniref:IBR finger domain protein n=1 Tax=Cordyceps fumosorosea (strain ARSEF 2679) TaxID=1081104 RepID=A0A167QLT6_CORFA|nr:IBR finger domain protein [Cordyceps fumosorosea ARSEF 2679]OAA57756.1 IBR finger domain protein [Cordyceps fumosorosea ARSEF 2679]